MCSGKVYHLGGVVVFVIVINPQSSAPACSTSSIGLSFKPHARCPYPGMYAEMAVLVFERLGINYTLIRYDGTWGTFNETSGTYYGLMRDILDGVIDADITAWTDTPTRQQYFHMPHLSWESQPVRCSMHFIPHPSSLPSPIVSRRVTATICSQCSLNRSSRLALMCGLDTWRYSFAVFWYCSQRISCGTSVLEDLNSSFNRSRFNEAFLLKKSKRCMAFFTCATKSLAQRHNNTSEIAKHLFHSAWEYIGTMLGQAALPTREGMRL